MIITKLRGGLGNQMFQAATGYALAKYHNTQLKLDISFLKEKTVSTETFTARKYNLDIFTYDFSIAEKKDIQFFFFKKNHIIERLIKKKQIIIVSNEESPESLYKKNCSNIYLNGFWQNEKYFNKYKNDVLNIFSFKNQARHCLKNNSVSIHVRRGDYISNKAANNILGVLPLGYYSKAIDIIKKKVEHPVFYVFSDDISWCKTNLDIRGIKLNYIENSNFEKDLQLMSLCSHNIIANSSFSWWGAWLNKNPDKIVIAPERWFRDTDKNKRTEIIPLNWLII